MRGRVIAYDNDQGRGIISGDDGNRYEFVRGSLGGNVRTVRSGADVDFDVTGRQATDIFVIGPASASAGQIGKKSKIAAGLLAILLGGLGIHKFYLGYAGAGIIMLLLFIFGFILLGIPTVIISIIALVEGIIYLTKSDEEFYETYEVGARSWF
jgi:TM2 domain-containing membrane protein YozV/cold shock CspA family protein